MALKAGQSSGDKRKFIPQEALEPQSYPARVVQVIDMGLQPQREYQGQKKDPAHQIMVTYELVTEFMKDEEGNDIEDKPRWVSEDFPLYSLGSERANSTKRYTVLDPTCEHEGDWAAMVGRPCQVVVTEYDKRDGGKGNGVGMITKVMKGYDTPELVNPGRFFDLDEPDMEVYGALPEWLRDKIVANLNYKGSVLEATLEGKSSDPAGTSGGEEGSTETGESNPTGTTTGQETGTASPTGTDSAGFDDDIPL